MVLRAFFTSLVLTALSFWGGGILYSEHTNSPIWIVIQLLRNFVIYFAVFILVFYLVKKLEKRK